MTAIYISTGVLSSLLGITLYITNTKVNKKPLFSFMLTLGVMISIADYIAARAQLFTFLLFVIEILFIECFIETKKKRYAIRTNAYSIIDCKYARCCILFFLHTHASIHRRVHFDKNQEF